MVERRALRSFLRDLILGPSASQAKAGTHGGREIRDAGAASLRGPRSTFPGSPVPRVAPLPEATARPSRFGVPSASQRLTPDQEPAPEWVRGGQPEGEEYLERIREKMERTALDFSRGLLNRTQFEELYAHYQKERASVERFLEMFPDSDAWRSVVTDGFSVAIRRRHQAKVVAYAIYHNETSLPLYTHGNFRMESELVVGMMSGFRSATAEIFGAGLRQTEVENDQSLYFMPGRYTTLIALYSSQPSLVQLKALEDVHRDFETANAAALARGSPQPDELVFPHRPVLE